MRVDEALTTMKEMSGMTLGEIAEYSDLKYRQDVSNIMRRKDVKISTLVKLADTMGFRLVLQNEETGSKIVIDE